LLPIRLVFGILRVPQRFVDLICEKRASVIKVDPSVKTVFQLI
jgi:hypothetical protein